MLSFGRCHMQSTKKIIMTVDILLLDEYDNVLLIRRAKPPFEDKFVLPGGHVDEGERFEFAAARELKEEVGIEVSPYDLQFICRLDAPDRDPRPGRRISYVFGMRIPQHLLTKARAGSDAQSIHLIRLCDLTRDLLGFDHYKVVEAFKERLWFSESSH